MTLITYRKLEEEDIETIRAVARKEYEQLMAAFKKSFTMKVKAAITKKT